MQLGFWAIGIATIWEAVFADVGVVLLTVIDNLGLQRIKYE